MAIRFTVERFPGNLELKNTSGLPWGCTIQPFSLEENTSTLSPEPLPRVDEVARCEDCYAYISGYCSIEKNFWRCSLCQALNPFSKTQRKRYGNEKELGQLRELQSNLVELDVALEEEEGQITNGDGVSTRPVYIALVDLNASEDELELVKSALLAALEALTPSSLFGLVTFSRKLGLYDLQGSIPVVKHVAIPDLQSQQLEFGLAEVMPLQAFLAPIDDHKDHVAAALETLRPIPAFETAAAAATIASTRAGGPPQPSRRGQRGFGSAVDALLRYLRQDEETFVSARLFAFLSGPPDFGAGQVAPTPTSMAEARPSASKEHGAFYKELAADAVQVGVCIDLFVVSNRYVNLAALQWLSTGSGGGIFLYPNVEEATLPQDIYRMLCRPHALGGVLRLRTSPQFSAARAYGHSFPDAKFEGVHHIIACDAFDTLCFDFEFATQSSFSRDPQETPTIQMAFQYTVLVPSDSQGPNPEASMSKSPSNGHTSGNTQNYVLRRRLRVLTVSVPLAWSPVDLYESADSEAILAILTHKVLQASLEEGVLEGRLLLQDWLVILTASYNDCYKLAQFQHPSTGPQLDVAFSLCPHLQPLPRIIFALLRSPLLQQSDEGIHPDMRVFLQCLYSALDPGSLLRAVYPLLSSYSSPNKTAFPRHSLSQAALTTSGSPIFFLDAFTTLIVYYSPAAPPDIPFPPPQNSLLRNTINRIKGERSLTPRTIMLRGGIDDVAPFERFLLEEQDVDGCGPARGMGFVAFLEQVATDTREFMK